MTCPTFTLENYNEVRALIIDEIEKFTVPGGDIIHGTFLRLGKYYQIILFDHNLPNDFRPL